MLKLDRGSLAAIFCAAKEKMRYALNGLSITDAECVATDGRKLIRVKHPEQEDKGDEVLVPRIVDRDDVEAALKGLSKKQRDHDDRKVIHVCVPETNENGAVHVSVPVGTTDRAPITMREIEGSFPEWKDVMPNGDDFTVGCCINGAYLEQILKVVAEVNKAREHDGCDPKDIILKLRLPVNAEPGHMVNAPVLIQNRAGDVEAALMPISVD